MFVEVNTLDDWAKGKKLFGKFDLKKYRHVEFQAMGVVEGGTKKGHTSVAFLLKDINDNYYMAECPLSILRVLSAMGSSADMSFKNQSTVTPNQEAN